MKHNTLNNIHFINDIMQIKIPVLYFACSKWFRAVSVYSTIHSFTRCHSYITL